MDFEPDILAKYAAQIKSDDLKALRGARVATLEREYWDEYRKLLAEFPDKELLEKRGFAAIKTDFSGDVICIGEQSDLEPTEHEVLEKLIGLLMPWRKGPFSLFGHFIDSEWRSNLKWERVRPHLCDLAGKRIADFGCGNGYYLLRLLGMLSKGAPECIFGFDPSEKFYLAFQLFKRVSLIPVSFEMFGVEEAIYFPEFFDLVLCLGVIYHQRDPIAMLRNLHQSMRPGARLILESQAVPGEGADALFVRDRYAKAHNVYYIPTAPGLALWAETAGFVNSRVVSEITLGPDEQRRTELAPYESLSDFLDPHDQTKTVEGHPAPLRVVLVCEKARGEA